MGSKVFICHAHEDLERARELYVSLRRAGFEPWMDKPPSEFKFEGLQPGSDWETEIRRRIKSADYFLACLSKVSVSKRGFVQKEYRLALEVASEAPPDHGYLVPVLLEDCEPPDHRVDTVDFRRLHWHRLYEDSAEDLVGFLNRRTARLQSLAPLDPLIVGGTFQEALERYNRLQEESNILYVELHDLTTSLDDHLQSLGSQVRAEKVNRKRVIAELSTRLGGFATALGPLAGDLQRARAAVSTAFLEFAAAAIDSEAATPLLLEDQARLVRRRKSVARALLSSTDRPYGSLKATPRFSQAFNRSRRQALVSLGKLRDGLNEEIQDVEKSLAELKRLETLL